MEKMIPSLTPIFEIEDIGLEIYLTDVIDEEDGLFEYVCHWEKVINDVFIKISLDCPDVDGAHIDIYTWDYDDSPYDFVDIYEKTLDEIPAATNVYDKIEIANKIVRETFTNPELLNELQEIVNERSEDEDQEV